MTSYFTHLLSENELGILIIGILASFELSDLDILLLELLVVALFFFDQTVEHRGGDCELGRGGHCEVDLRGDASMDEVARAWPAIKRLYDFTSG